MSRRKRTFERPIIKDYKYESSYVARFINYTMLSGKKTIAEDIVYGALSGLQKVADENSITILEAFLKIIETVRPTVKMMSRRVGGATYQIPVEIDKKRGEMIAMKWIIGAARSGSGRPMVEKLLSVLLESFAGKGPAVKKSEEMRKSAEANKAFAHFA